MPKGKVTRLNDYKDAKCLGELREYPDSFEYCVIPKYEDKFTEVHTECVQMDRCFANIIKNGDHYVLISIIFSDEWKIDEVVDWLERFEITLHNPTETMIEIHNANSIIDSKKFRNYPLVLSERGTKTIGLNPNELQEVTEEYDTYKKITNTGLAEPIGGLDEFLDKDDCLDRKYPGVAGEEDEPLFEEIKENVQYSDTVRGLFINCKNCSFESVLVHLRTFEIEQPHCPYCGSKIDISNCEWVNGPFNGR